jgi:inorganic pyrophosphatase
MVHPWHDLSYGHFPDKIEVFIEVSKNSMLKYELDKSSGILRLDRVLYSAVHYPGDYGFIPRTLSEDGDPMDVLIISNFPVQSGVIVSARIIGILFMVDGDEKDEKIIAVHAGDPRFDRYHDMHDVAEHVRMEIIHFFETYKILQSKQVRIDEVKGVQAAKLEVTKAIKRYEDKFGKK